MSGFVAQVARRFGAVWDRYPAFDVLSRWRWHGYLVATMAVILSNAIIGLAVAYLPDMTDLSTLNLVPVLLVAVAFGRGAAIWASAASFLLFNWFFVEPLHTLSIADADAWIVLFVFLFTAIATSQLAASQRQRAQEAERREIETAVLYDTARLLGELGLEQAIRAVAERLRQELGLKAVAIEWLGETGTRERAVAGATELLADFGRRGSAPYEFLAAGSAPSETRRGEIGHWVRVVPPQGGEQNAGRRGAHLKVVPIRIEQQEIGQILLIDQRGRYGGDPAADRVVPAVANQVGMAVERARLRREATEAEILRRADDLRTALLNAVSHDLRTPLSSIIASAGSLRRQDVQWSAADREEFAAAIEEEARRLNRIVENFLALSRLEAGALRPQKDWYDLGALVDDVVGRLKTATAGHKVRLEVADDLPPLFLDYVEIDQVLSNLLENAAKYSPEGSEIVVSARQVGAEVHVAVTDSGPGIPAAALARIFEPFYRADRAESLAKGTGLGLAVARGLVLAHGGRIWAENLPGQGSRFTFTLPLGNLASAETHEEGVQRQ